MTAYVYILFSKKNGTLYVGVTTDLVKRVYEHKNKFVEGFTKRYNVDKLGYIWNIWWYFNSNRKGKALKRSIKKKETGTYRNK